MDMADKTGEGERTARDDGGVVLHPESDTEKTSNPEPGYHWGETGPHDMESEGNVSINGQILLCPCCRKPAIHTEFTQNHEVRIKCPLCGFFMEMSNGDWHLMEKSASINDEILKMAELKELVKC